MNKVFVALSTFAQDDTGPLDVLKSSGLSFALNTTGKRLTAAQVITDVQGCDGVVAGLEPYDAAVIKALPQLRCISRCGVGIDNVDMSAAQAAGITVLNTPHVVVQPVAELTLAMIFDLLRKTTAHTALMRQNKWERLSGMQLAGKKAGVVGLGRIGRRVAELLTRLDVEVYGYDVFPDTAWAAKNNVRLLGLNDVLRQCDIITLHLATSKEHPFHMGAQEIALMPKGAIFINVARGALVDEAALAQSLHDGHLGGAGLDVYSEEPYQGPLCAAPNTVLTPHVGTLTLESRAAMEKEAVANLIGFFKERQT